MKKKILMIGDTSDLHGVPVDIRSYYDFFTSPVGGNWHHNEIETLRSPSRRLLYKKLDEIERADYDYVITIFSGHGKESICGTILVINGEADTIDAADLANLSPRQLSIFDCCRSFTAMPTDTQGTVLSMSHDPIRKAYEERVEKSAPQEIILFACDENESATDTVDEDIQSYSQYLLDATQMILDEARESFIRVSQAHVRARGLILKNPKMQQRPKIRQPNLPIEQRLPFAVNPNFF